MKEKIYTAALSIASNTLLISLKFIVGLLSGSVSIISEAIHSSLDLVAAIIAFFSVRVSDNPPDKEHPYGHGKVENISGVIEGVLILIAAGWIIIEAVKKLKGLGGYCIAQNEETCVVYGMPKTIVDADLADLVLPAEKIPETINRII